MRGICHLTAGETLCPTAAALAEMGSTYWSPNFTRHWGVPQPESGLFFDVSERNIAENPENMSAKRA